MVNIHCECYDCDHKFTLTNPDTLDVNCPICNSNMVIKRDCDYK